VCNRDADHASKPLDWNARQCSVVCADVTVRRILLRGAGAVTSFKRIAGAPHTAELTSADVAARRCTATADWVRRPGAR
jgi:hypothetical protein